MITNSHPISCVSLTKSMLNEILHDAGYSYTAVLVSSMGSVFVLGDTENFEIIEIDDHHEQYVINDAGDVERTILFHDEMSDYGVLVSVNGVVTSTTGLVANDDDPDHFKEFVKHETGVLGQECESCQFVETQDTDDDEYEDMH